MNPNASATTDTTPSSNDDDSDDTTSIQSESREEMLYVNDSTSTWTPRVPIEQLFTRRIRDGGFVRVRVELLAAHPLTEFIMTPCNGGKVRLG